MHIWGLQQQYRKRDAKPTRRKSKTPPKDRSAKVKPGLQIPGLSYQQRRLASRHIKLLGDTIDKDLRFDKHVAALDEKVGRTNTALRRVTKLTARVTGDVAKRLFLSWPRPQLECASNVWCPHLSPTQKREIHQLQNDALRAAVGAFGKAPTDVVGY